MMSVLFAVSGMLLSGFLIHLIVWQIFLPRNQSAGLFVIFGFWLAILASLYAMDVTDVRTQSGWSLGDLALVLLTYVSSVFIYVTIYSLFEHDSPTLLMARQVEAAGSTGLLRETLSADDSANTFTDRLGHLLETRFVRKEADNLELSRTGLLIAAVFNSAGVILGLGKGGG